MTETEIDHKEEAKKLLARYNQVVAISEGMKATNSRAKAKKSLDDLAANLLIERGDYADIDALNASPNKDAKIAEASQILMTYDQDGKMYLKKNLKDIVRNEEGGIDKKLLKVTTEKEFANLLDGASDKDREFGSKLIHYLQYKSIAEADNPLSKITSAEQAKEIQEYQTKGVYTKKMNEILKKGFDDKRAQAEGRLAALINQDKPTSEIIKLGAKELAKESKEELIKKYSPEFEDKGAKLVKDRIKFGLESSDPELEGIAYNLSGKYLTGYKPGERSYKEMFSE